MRAGLSAYRCKWPDTLSYGFARMGRHDRGAVGRESTFKNVSHQPSVSVRLELSTPPRGKWPPRRAPGPLYPRNLSEVRVDRPEVPGGLVTADAVAGTGHHRGPDQVVVHRLLPARLDESGGTRSRIGTSSASLGAQPHGRETRDVVRALKRIDQQYAPASVTDRLRNRPKDVPR